MSIQVWILSLFSSQGVSVISLLKSARCSLIYFLIPAKPPHTHTHNHFQVEVLSWLPRPSLLIFKTIADTLLRIHWQCYYVCLQDNEVQWCMTLTNLNTCAHKKYFKYSDESVCVFFLVFCSHFFTSFPSEAVQTDRSIKGPLCDIDLGTVKTLLVQ